MLTIILDISTISTTLAMFKVIINICADPDFFLQERRGGGWSGVGVGDSIE